MKGERLDPLLWLLFLHPLMSLYACPLIRVVLKLGSTMDAMSAAVDNSEVVLYGVSLAYKESANCREHSTRLCCNPIRLCGRCHALC